MSQGTSLAVSLPYLKSAPLFSSLTSTVKCLDLPIIFLIRQTLGLGAPVFWLLSPSRDLKKTTQIQTLRWIHSPAASVPQEKRGFALQRTEKCVRLCCTCTCGLRLCSMIIFRYFWSGSLSEDGAFSSGSSASFSSSCPLLSSFSSSPPTSSPYCCTSSNSLETDRSIHQC